MADGDESLSEGQPTQFMYEPISNYCSFGMRHFLLTGLYRDVLVRHFGSPPPDSLVEHPELRHLFWDDTERTGILVESVTAWRPELTEKRPAVIIKRHAFKNVRYGIGDSIGANKEADDEFVTFWVGSHTIFCIGNKPQIAEILGCEVERELLQFGPELLRSLDLMRFHVEEIGEIGEIEEATESFVVPITVAVAYQEKWRIVSEAPKLRRISLSCLLCCDKGQ